MYDSRPAQRTPQCPWTKLVVRRLPPGLDEGVLCAVLAEEEGGGPRLHWTSFWPGGGRGGGQARGSAGEFSRFYLAVDPGPDVEAVFRALHGHVFHADKGREYRAAVDVAVNHIVPGQPYDTGMGGRWDYRKHSPDADPPSAPDPLAGTLEADEEFLQFKQRLEAAPEELPSAEALLVQQNAASQKSSIGKSALVAYLESQTIRGTAWPKTAGALRRQKQKMKAAEPRVPDLSREKQIHFSCGKFQWPSNEPSPELELILKKKWLVQRKKEWLAQMKKEWEDYKKTTKKRPAPEYRGVKMSKWESGWEVTERLDREWEEHKQTTKLEVPIPEEEWKQKKEWLKARARRIKEEWMKEKGEWLPEDEWKRKKEEWEQKKQKLEKGMRDEVHGMKYMEDSSIPPWKTEEWKRKKKKQEREARKQERVAREQPGNDHTEPQSGALAGARAGPSTRPPIANQSVARKGEEGAQQKPAARPAGVRGGVEAVRGKKKTGPLIPTAILTRNDV